MRYGLILLLCIAPNAMGQHWTPLRNAVWGTGGCLPVGSAVFTPIAVGTPQPIIQALVIIPTTPVATPVRVQTPRPDGYGYCTTGCTCGCNEGKPCRCGLPVGLKRPTVGDEPPKKEQSKVDTSDLPKWITSGVHRDKIPDDGREICIVNGGEVSCQRLLATLGANVVPNDAETIRVVLIGSDATRSKAINELENSKAWSDWKANTIVQAYAPDHWHVRDLGYRQFSDPTLYIVRGDGKVLHRSDYEGPENVAEARRKVDPSYDPNKDPDVIKPKQPDAKQPDIKQPSDGGTKISTPSIGLIGVICLIALAVFGKRGKKV